MRMRKTPGILPSYAVFRNGAEIGLKEAGLNGFNYSGEVLRILENPELFGTLPARHGPRLEKTIQPAGRVEDGVFWPSDAAQFKAWSVGRLQTVYDQQQVYRPALKSTKSYKNIYVFRAAFANPCEAAAAALIGGYHLTENNLLGGNLTAALTGTAWENVKMMIAEERVMNWMRTES